MAFPTAVNDQITDSVTQANVSTLAQAPAMAMGTIYQSLAQSTGLALANGVSAQQSGDVVAQAATTQAVAQLLGLPTAKA